MPEYVIEATDTAGDRRTHTVEAESLRDAVEQLRRSGHADITPQTDDIGAHLIADTKQHKPQLDAEQVAAAATPAGHVAYGLRKHLWWWVVSFVALGWFVLRRVADSPWRGIDYLIIAMLVLDVVVIASFALSHLTPSVRAYRRVIEAGSWARWQQVLALLPELEPFVAQGKIPAHEVAFRKAGAMAGLGDLEAALELVRPFETDDALPSWLYWARLVSVYQCAKRHDEAMRTLERAIELRPDDPVLTMELAWQLVHRRGDADGAGRLCAEADLERLPATTRFVDPLVRGAIELAHERADVARPLLQRALGLTSSSQPWLTIAHRNWIHAYLALAHAHEGQRELARTHYDEARPWLQAVGETELLERCDEALPPP